MPMKQIAFRIPEELEKKLPKPSLEGDRTRFLRDMIDARIKLDNALMLYCIDKPRGEKTSLRDADLLEIKEADPSFETVLQELQYLRQLN